MVSLFCRHNRFTADCPICSRGTVLDAPTAGGGSRSSGASRGGAERKRSAAKGPVSGRAATGRRAVTVRGPYSSAGPYVREGESYEVRLERVPGGLRLAEWAAGVLRASAPVLAASDVPALFDEAAASGALEPSEHAALRGAVATATGESAEHTPPDGAAANVALETAVSPSPGTETATATGHGTSPGSSGELREELRVERLDHGRLRIARWVLRPGTGWDLLDAPTMLVPRRYAEAFADAARQGLLTA